MVFWVAVRRRLPLWRREAGLRQEDIAKAIGTTQSNIAMTETGFHQTILVGRATRWLSVLGREIVVDGPDETVSIPAWDEENSRAVGMIIRNVREKTVRRTRVPRGWAGGMYMSQDELARLAGCAPSTVQAVEAGQSEPRITTILGIFLALRWEPEIREQVSAE